MIRLSTRDFIHQVAMPCLLYVLLFFGGSEIVEHYYFLRVDEATMHILHIARGIFSVFFIAGMVVMILNRAEKNYGVRLEAVCSLLSAGNQGLLAYDASRNVVSINSLASELIGSIHSGDFRTWTGKIFAGAVESTVLNPQGTKKLRVIRLDSHDSGHLLLLQDVTQEKKNEEQWLIAEKLASVGRMAAGLAHEIGTPLNIISGRAELIQSMQSSICQNCESRPLCPVDQHIKVIFRQIDRISGIIQQLLSQAREPRKQKSNFGIGDCIESVVEFLAPYLEKKNIELHINLQSGLPPIYGYSDQMQQVLLNLVTNSIDAIAGKHGHIAITASAAGAEIQLIISDTGTGIPEENLTKIFDPFFTTKEFGKGTGLGLTVSANIVKAHEGTIDVQSSAESGTKFILHLPCRQAQEEPAAAR